MTQLLTFDNYFIPKEVVTNSNVTVSTTYTTLYIGVNPAGIQGDPYGDINVVRDINGAYVISTGNKGDPTFSKSNYIMNASPDDGNTNMYRTAYGVHAGQTNQGEYATALGYCAGQTNQGSSTVAAGYCAGQIDQGPLAVALGYCAGQTYQGLGAVAVGYCAGETAQSPWAVAVGAYAGQVNQGEDAVAVGAYAGQSNQGIRSIALGANAGQYYQGDDAIAIGHNAGLNYQGDHSICIGSGAGNGIDVNNHMGIGAIAIGYNCAANAAVPAYSICIGAECQPPQAEGRLAFGSHMEALATTANTGTNGSLPNQVEGYITIEHNGVVYRLPLYKV